jgi:chromate transporter
VGERKSPGPSPERAGVEKRRNVLEVLGVMGRLGLTSFGGPAGHIALMEHEAVRRRNWIARDEFLEMVAVTNLIPGPNATELAIQLGYVRAGWWGFLLAGAAFILPASLLSALLAWIYLRSGSLPSVQTVFRLGIQPVALAIILTATWRLGRTALRDWTWALWGAAALAGELAGVDATWILLGAGLASLARAGLLSRGMGPLAFLALVGAGNTAPATAHTPVSVGLFFLKVGALLFGSGMVLFAFVERGLVGGGWLTSGQLADAIAVGQMTPGPVLSSATFIGWLLAGPLGAVAATLGAFLPAFGLMSVIAPHFRRLRRHAWLREALSGVSAAVVGIMLGMALRIALGMAWDAGTAVLSLGALLLLLVRSPAWAVVLLGAGAGALRLV